VVIPYHDFQYAVKGSSWLQCDAPAKIQRTRAFSLFTPCSLSFSFLYLVKRKEENNGRSSNEEVVAKLGLLAIMKKLREVEHDLLSSSIL